MVLKSKKVDKMSTLEPEEGLKAWLVVLGSFLAQFSTFGVLYSFSVMVTTMEEKFQVPRATISLVYQLQLATFMGGGVITGRLADSYGIRPIFSLGTVFFFIALILASYSQTFVQVVLSQGLLLGLSSSAIYWPAATVVPQWFSKRRGLAVGISVLGSGVGNFVIVLILEPLIQNHGLAYSLRILSAICLILQVIAGLLLKRRLPNTGRRGFMEDADVFRSRNFQLLAFGAMFFQAGYMVPFSSASPFIEELGFDTTFAATAVSLIGIGSAIGRISIGFVADRLGSIRTFQASMVATGIICAVWWFCQTRGSLIAFSLFFGGFSGSFIALVPLVFGEYFGLARLGSVMGYVSLVLVPGSFIGPFAGGKLYDETGDYRATAIFTGCCTCFAGVVVCFLKLPKKNYDDAEADPRGSVSGSVSADDWKTLAQENRLAELTEEELRGVCKENDLAETGTKEELLERVEQFASSVQADDSTTPDLEQGKQAEAVPTPDAAAPQPVVQATTPNIADTDSPVEPPQTETKAPVALQ